MPVYNTFAKRKQQAENAGKPVIYTYDDLPQSFRVQVSRILKDTIGDPKDQYIGYSDYIDYEVIEENVMMCESIWQRIHDTLAQEMGVIELIQDDDKGMNACLNFVLKEDDIYQVLSLVELGLNIAQDYNHSIGNAVNELNHRFLEHSIGYQYQDGYIVQVDSQYLHAEAVEPAVTLLRDAHFAGAEQEFMDAHKHYRQGNYKEAIANAGNAFESTMKAICDERGWTLSGNRTAGRLIETLFNNGLIPAEMNSHFSSLRATLESGLPTARNQPGHGAHGQGANPVAVPDYLAAYCLHLAATNIVFLVEAHNAGKR